MNDCAGFSLQFTSTPNVISITVVLRCSPAITLADQTVIVVGKPQKILDWPWTKESQFPAWWLDYWSGNDCVWNQWDRERKRCRPKSPSLVLFDDSDIHVSGLRLAAQGCFSSSKLDPVSLLVTLMRGEILSIFHFETLKKKRREMQHSLEWRSACPYHWHFKPKHSKRLCVLDGSRGIIWFNIHQGICGSSCKTAT